jgi:two-component system LytT family sensor kinase
MAGIAAGMLPMRFSHHDEIWKFSPFQILNSIQYGRERGWEAALKNSRTQIMFLCIFLEALRIAAASVAGTDNLFALVPGNPGIIICVFIGTIVSVGIPLKIWDNTRIELKLEEREKQLLRSRYEILRSQINPHFLFNTLNSIASLIRTDQDKARDIVLKLSTVLRTLLKEQRDLVPVKEEIELIDKYLAIEQSRFGDDNLAIAREIDDSALEVLIPGMMLQPIVENAIKHGISQKIGGGKIDLTIHRENNTVIFRVADNGIGTDITEEKAILERGIGLNNIKERLEMVYGEQYTFSIDSRKNEGTTVIIKVPLNPVINPIT